MEKFVSEPYWISPEGLKVDERIAGFNPPKTEEDYNALKYQISKYGQKDPVYMRDNLLGNGRNRMQIAKELGSKVLAIDVNPEMSDEEYIIMCNTDTFGGRNDTPAQKAIKAYKLVKDHGFTKPLAKQMVGIKDKNALGYVTNIASSSYYFVLDKIHNNETVELISPDGHIVYRGSSLRRLSTEISILEEAAVLKVNSTEELGSVQIDYNQYIKTETSKELFWRFYGTDKTITHEAKILVCELLNLKYSVQNKEKDK